MMPPPSSPCLTFCLQVSSATAQTSLFLIACSAFCAALMWWRPYESRAFFLAELASLACLLLTAALAPMTVQPSSDLTSTVSDIATMLMIIANVATVAGLALLYALRAVGTYAPAVAAQLARVSDRLPCCRLVHARSVPSRAGANDREDLAAPSSGAQVVSGLSGDPRSGRGLTKAGTIPQVAPPVSDFPQAAVASGFAPRGQVHGSTPAGRYAVAPHSVLET